MDERELLIRNVNEAMPMTPQMKQLEETISSLSEEYNKKKKTGIIGAISIFFGGIFLLTGISTSLLSIEEKNTFNLITALFITILGFVIIHVGYKKKKKRAKKCEKLLAENRNQLTILQSSPGLAWLPPDYRTSECINIISSYVNSGRAETMKEALALLDQTIHNERMENAAFLGAYYSNRVF